MVLSGEMATTTTRHEQRSKALHNFPLPNSWGNQRHLKCTKNDSISSGSGDHRTRRGSPPLRVADSSVLVPFRFDESDHRQFTNAPYGGDEGIEEFRVKIMSDLKTMRDEITQSMFPKDAIKEQEEINVSGSGSVQEKETEIPPVMPWNLRKRRATSISGNHCCSLEKISSGSVSEKRTVMNPSTLRSGVVGAETKKKPPPKFSVKLSKKEIEEDFKAILGHGPPRRPKKRPRTVQKNLDNFYPGLYLDGVSLDSYKV